MSRPTSSPIAFALDFPSLAEARASALRLRGVVGMIKVGLELFVEAGPAALGLGEETGLPVFLDLKLHDIPATVERAVGRAASLGARVLTVHAGGGPAMLRAAVARAEKEGTGLAIAAVTVLTSLDDGDLRATGVADGTALHAARLARLAFDCGVRSFVCSPGEVAGLRAALGPDAVLITPGVRPSARGPAATTDDQKRVATAAEAVQQGADWIVVGRPIRDAADPVAAAMAINDDVQRAREGRKS